MVVRQDWSVNESENFYELVYMLNVMRVLCGGKSVLSEDDEKILKEENKAHLKNIVCELGRYLSKV